MKEQRKYSNPVTATYNGIAELFRKRARIDGLGPGDRIDGKKVMITGSSSGLGLATAKELAGRGARVIMAVRSGIPGKGEEVKSWSGSDSVSMHRVDLADLGSIQNLVSGIKSQYGTIDILICNAAVVAKNARKTRHGLDEMFTVNYLAKFYLVNLLVKNNCFNTDDGHIPRVIFVSSESHRNPEMFEWDSFGEFAPFTIGKSVERYGYYKLLMTTFSRELSRRLNPNKSTAYSVFALCPGPVNSNIAREAPALFQPLLKLVFSIFFRSPKTASEPVVYFAVSKEVEGKATDYLYLMSREEVDEKASNMENGKKLWALSEVLLENLGY